MKAAAFFLSPTANGRVRLCWDVVVSNGDCVHTNGYVICKQGNTTYVARIVKIIGDSTTAPGELLLAKKNHLLCYCKVYSLQGVCQ